MHHNRTFGTKTLFVLEKKDWIHVSGTFDTQLSELDVLHHKTDIIKGFHIVHFCESDQSQLTKQILANFLTYSRKIILFRLIYQ